MDPHGIRVDIVLPLAPQQRIQLLFGLGMKKALERRELSIGQRVLRKGVCGAFGMLRQLG